MGKDNHLTNEVLYISNEVSFVKGEHEEHFTALKNGEMDNEQAQVKRISIHLSK